MFSTLAVAEQVQVGNKIYLYLPGEVEFDEPFEVAKDGTITLPELGKIKVTGAELAEIEQQLRAALSEVYVAMDDFYLEIRSRDIFINVMAI